MSQRIADASAKVMRSFYPLSRMTDNVLSAALGQLTGQVTSEQLCVFNGIHLFDAR